VFVNLYNTDTGHLDYMAWAATSTDLSFDVWFNFVPATGTAYTVTWFVVN
jgi:chitodextrinase